MKRIKYSELLEAVQRGKTKRVRLALKQGRDPNHDVYDGVATLLDWAVQESHAKIVKLLVRYGADIHAASDGITPLFNAAGDGNLEMVRLLLKLGADVNHKESMGTALHNATAYGNEDVARYLIDHGADVNARDHRGWTPLFFAGKNGYESLIALLLSAGADKDIQDKKGRRAVDVARASADKVIARRNRSIALKEAIVTMLT